MIKRTKKVCIQCKELKFIFSHGRCSYCTKLIGATLKKSVKKEKKESVKSLVKELDDWFSRFIRLRDCDGNGVCRCVTCGTFVEVKYIQDGHYFPRNKKALRWNETNNHCQDFYCNVTLKGNYIVYGDFMERKYGKEYVELLKSMQNNELKMTRFEYQVLIEDYKAKVEKLLIEKNIIRWWKQ